MSKNASQPKLIACNGHKELSSKIADCLGIKLAKVIVNKIPNGEIVVTIGESLRDQDVYICQTGYGSINDLLMELLITISGCKKASAKRITAVIPCFPYARQDKKDRGRCPITAKLVANLLTEAGADHIITMELHAEQIKGFFKNIPIDNLSSLPIILNHVKQYLTNGLESVIVAPDAGGVKRCTALSDALQIGFAIIHKERVVANKVSQMVLVGGVSGKNCILFDDMADTCGTLCAAAEILKLNGAVQVIAMVIHPILSGEAVRTIESSQLDKLISCDTNPMAAAAKNSPKISQIDTSKIFAEAIRRNHSGESISFLFKHVPDV